MLVVAYYTPVGRYPEEAARLRASCERWGLRHLVQEVTDKGSWHRTCNHRPTWLFDKLIAFREAILYCDCDCEIVKPPDLLFGCAADFAAYNFAADPDTDVRRHGPYDPNRLLVSGGVLYFAYTAPALELLGRWISAINQEPDTRETDPVLDLVYNASRIPLRTLWLPKSYNRLADRWQHIEPVIDHHYQCGALRGEPRDAVPALAGEAVLP